MIIPTQAVVHCALPANGRFLGPTYSVIMTKVLTTLPGIKKPVRNRNVVYIHRLGENAPMILNTITAIVDTNMIILRPNLLRKKQ